MKIRRLLLALTICVAMTVVTIIMASQKLLATQRQARGVMTWYVSKLGTKTIRLSTPNVTTESTRKHTASSHTEVVAMESHVKPETGDNAKPESSSKKEVPKDVSRVTPKPPAPQPTNRSLTCQNCFSSKFLNLTQVPEVCSLPPNSTKPEMLMMITSSLDGFEPRQAIRETWASLTKGNTAHVRHVFLLGTGSDGKISDDLRNESARYDDMLVSDYVDVYGNLTLKTMAGLHYMVDHCPDAKYFLKTDQDMYIFVERVLDLAKQHDHTLQTSLGGTCYQTGKPWRDPNSRYYASYRSYPQSTYPGFCSGTGYIGSMNVARKVVETSPNIPFFHLEDAYLGLVLRHVGYNLTRYDGFSEGAGVCQDPSRVEHAMTIHGMSPQAIRDFWIQERESEGVSVFVYVSVFVLVLVGVFACVYVCARV